jgi:hypothetical protein
MACKSPGRDPSDSPCRLASCDADARSESPRENDQVIRVSSSKEILDRKTEKCRYLVLRLRERAVSCIAQPLRIPRWNSLCRANWPQILAATTVAGPVQFLLSIKASTDSSPRRRMLKSVCVFDFIGPAGGCGESGLGRPVPDPPATILRGTSVGGSSCFGCLLSTSWKTRGRRGRRELRRWTATTCHEDAAQVWLAVRWWRRSHSRLRPRSRRRRGDPSRPEI